MFLLLMICKRNINLIITMELTQEEKKEEKK